MFIWYTMTSLKYLILLCDTWGMNKIYYKQMLCPGVQSVCFLFSFVVSDLSASPGIICISLHTPGLTYCCRNAEPCTQPCLCGWQLCVGCLCLGVPSRGLSGAPVNANPSLMELSCWIKHSPFQNPGKKCLCSSKYSFKLTKLQSSRKTNSYICSYICDT